MKLKTLRENRTAAMWEISQKRAAAGGESSKAGFFALEIGEVIDVI